MDCTVWVFHLIAFMKLSSGFMLPADTVHEEPSFFLLTETGPPFILVKAGELLEMFIFLRVWKNRNLGVFHLQNEVFMFHTDEA